MSAAELRPARIRSRAPTERHPDEPTIHAVWHGLADCGLPGQPSMWPPGHKWVNRGSVEVNCFACLAKGKP